MKLKTLLLFFLLGFSTMVSVGQRAAKATMRVSVKVVTGSSINVESPTQVRLINNSESMLGMLTMNGFEKDDVLIDTPKNVKLNDKEGKIIEMRVKKFQEDINKSTTKLSFLGISKNNVPSGIYKGELTTTIQYL